MNRNRDLMNPGRLLQGGGCAADQLPRAAEGAGGTSDERILREKVREAIYAGELPDHPPDQTWGGPGSGCPCTICGAPVNHDEAEIELEFAGDDGCPGQENFRVHVRCLAAWESELDRIRPARRPSGSRTGTRSEPNVGTAASASRRVLPNGSENGTLSADGGNQNTEQGPK